MLDFVQLVRCPSCRQTAEIAATARRVCAGCWGSGRGRHEMQREDLWRCYRREEVQGDAF